MKYDKIKSFKILKFDEIKVVQFWNLT
jgi:hypothetical protein